MRQSLLVQLLGMYGGFVAAVLIVGLLVNSIVQQQLRTEVQRADLDLARAIALELDVRMRNARSALAELARLDAIRHGDTAAMASAFRAFKAARQDIDRIYWIDAAGIMQVSEPATARTLGTDYSEERVFQRAGAATGSLIEAGVVDLTTYNPVAILAQPVRGGDGRLLGIVATNVLLADLSAPLRAIVGQQQGQLLISVIDEEGQLIVTPERERLLQPVLEELPGAEEALAGRPATRLGRGPHGREWLYSAEPVPSVGWAVVVQRPAIDALAVVRSFNAWLTIAALLFGAGGLLFWALLIWRIIRPLQALAAHHQGLPGTHPARLTPLDSLARRGDEVGGLARSLHALDHAVALRLDELHTLLETSTAVVGTLDPGAVISRIIAAVRQLVDVKAVTVLVPDAQGALRVLASEGHSEHYDRSVHILPDDLSSPSALALREGRPVQLLAGERGYFPPISYAEGFRAVLAVPIISPHAGGVALLVYRTRPQPYSPEEIELLLTFANFATLAWEHAVLYERSDERLRAVAAENEQLYRRAIQEKQVLAAIMGSMSDGLVLAGEDGMVLYANRGASEIIADPDIAIAGWHIDAVHATLRGATAHPAAYDQARARAENGGGKAWLVELPPEQCGRVIDLRLFDVRGESGEIIGRGMLLRDVTREHEIDQFKTTLLGAVGHELRTPLAAIKGHASTMLQDDVSWSAEEQRHFLQTISDEADRLAQLVSGLLDLSRLEAGLVVLRRTPCQLGDLIARVVQRLHPSADQRIIIDAPADLPPLAIDGPRIEVVVRNLLANALAYGGGTVWVRAEKRPGIVIIAVADDGGGIVPDELPHIFERFYRARQGWQRRSGGTGLGLAICKAFVEAHGGAIWAESVPNGATIAFSLPVLAASADQTVTALAVERDGSQG
jgi:signal transduction histidine kinase